MQCNPLHLAGKVCGPDVPSGLPVATHIQAEYLPKKGITLHCCVVALLAFTKHPYIVIAHADTLYGEACLSKLARTLADP